MSTLISKIKKLYSEEWNSLQVSRWENIRGKGKWRYVVNHYVLLWGVSVAAALSALAIYTSPTPLYLPRVFVANFTIWPIFGFFLGIFEWRSNEKKYNKYNSKFGSA